MYSLVVLLSLLATSLFLRAYTVDERPARRWPVLFGLALAAALYTHNWALFLGRGDVRRWLGLLFLAPAAERRARLLDGALGFGARRAAVPAVGADAAVPGRPHRRAVVAPARLRAADDGGDAPAARPHRVARAGGRPPGAASSRSCGRAAGRQLTAQGRAVLAVGDRGGRDRAARLRRLAALAGVGDALPGGRRPAVPAARRRRPRRRARPRHPRPRDRRDPVGLRRVADDQEQRPRRSPRHRPEPQPGDVVVSTQPEQVPVLHHYLPPGLRYATLTGYVEGRRRDRLARRRRAPRARAPRSATSSRSSTSSRPASGS